jgi:hypothetical protein
MAINPSEITTIRVGELPTGTIELTSKIAVENGTDLQQIDGQDLVDFVNINANAFQFEIKDLWVTQGYIDDNFDETGLGVDLCEGYAICNGQNGTPNLDGLVSIGYGNNYNVIKAIGGSKNAVVVEHSHQGLFVGGSNRDNGDPGLYIITGNGEPNGIQSNPAGYTAIEGVSGINKNMQPYMVLLKIMKL